LTTFFRGASPSTPSDVWPQTHPCFLACGIGRVGAAPSAHQAQGRVTSRLLAKRLPLAPVVPQKTVDSLPCPIVDCSHGIFARTAGACPLKSLEH